MTRIIKARQIHPQVRLIGSAYRLMMPLFTEKTMPLMNKCMDSFIRGRWLGRKTKIEERYIERTDGSKLRILICTGMGKAGRNLTGLLWIHGGGYAIGLPEQDFMFADNLADDGNTVMVMPDYTRSTDRPYPAALEDCYLALLWMKEHAGELGINEDQLFVGGDSAGGGLTAAVCLYARDRGEVKIAFQMPLYPMLDDRMLTQSSQNNDAPVWDSKRNQAAWGMYLKDVAGEKMEVTSDAEHDRNVSGEKRSTQADVPIYAAPARATDLNGMPPMCTYVGTIEPFHDETVEYAKKLRAHGIKVHMRTYKGCFHAFDMMGYGTALGRNAREYLKRVYRYAQKHYFAAQE